MASPTMMTVFPNFEYTAILLTVGAPAWASGMKRFDSMIAKVPGRFSFFFLRVNAAELSH